MYRIKRAIELAKQSHDVEAQNLGITHLRVYRTDIPRNPTVVSSVQFMRLISRYDS